MFKPQNPVRIAPGNDHLKNKFVNFSWMIEVEPRKNSPTKSADITYFKIIKNDAIVGTFITVNVENGPDMEP